jgi:hypothetical protein
VKAPARATLSPKGERAGVSTLALGSVALFRIPTLCRKGERARNPVAQFKPIRRLRWINKTMIQWINEAMIQWINATMNQCINLHQATLARL